MFVNYYCNIYTESPVTALWPGGRGYSIYPWVGRCGAPPHTLTLFKTNIADFPTLFKTEFRFLIPCLRHLTRNHTLCKTIIDIETLSHLIHWQSQNYLQLDQDGNEELFTLSISSLHQALNAFLGSSKGLS